MPVSEASSVGAVPRDLVEVPRAGAFPEALSSLPEDGPFAMPGARPDAPSEASALAAEAAAVRALDSGPLTPPPELTSESLSRSAAPDLPMTPAPAVAAGTEIAEPTPAPEPASTRDVLEPATPPPGVEPAPELQQIGALPDAALESPPAHDSTESRAVPAGEVAALPAAVLEDDADDHIEVVDGNDTSSDGESVSSPSSRAAASARGPSPPPIPGSYFKTPGPEPIAPSSASDGEEISSPLLPPGLPILPEALSQRPRRPKRSKPWFEEVFDEDYLRTLPFMRPDQTLREVEFIMEALRLGPGTEVLDVACGYGRHAIELVQRGVSVTGLDLSLPLLIRAADESQRRSLSVNFVHADMREMAFERQFDGAYSMLTSFGYFDEETNLRVAERIGRALKPGARFLLDVVNRDYIVSDLPVRVWWEGTGCVVLEEVDFNFHTSRILTHRSIVFEDGRQVEQEISVRAYSLHEIGRLLRQAGFRVIDVSGGLSTRGQFFGSSSRSLLVLAEKREEDVA